MESTISHGATCWPNNSMPTIWLAPPKIVGLMMGVWFMASALGNLIAGLVGGHIDPEKLEQMPALFKQTSLSLFAAAVVCGLLVFPVRRMMRGVPAGDR